MANYYTEAAFEINLELEQKIFALQVLECAEDEKVDFTKSHKTAHEAAYPKDVYRLAKKFVKSLDDYEPGSVYLPFEYADTGDSIHIAHDESINTEAAATFCYLILKHFDSDGYVCIEAAHTCSKPRPDGFGGHAAFVTKKGVKWMSTGYWIHKNITRHKKAA
jgi:hypothetical protein